MTSPIYRIGTRDRSQAALRDDGQWFVRSRDNVFNRYGRWKKTISRPQGAWYDPSGRRARLPEDNEVEDFKSIAVGSL